MLKEAQRYRSKEGKRFGFSLIELMISLIAISVITAAFTPVISKNIKSGYLTIGSTGGEYITTYCDAIDTSCKMCDTKKNR
ncbi:prepilin-type N-terminal cleavage/methylation domain-containing protein, partial [bacterium]|nr:prepilin-type N-terminal cleavage/methylation domain-containing protein [bacterium]